MKNNALTDAEIAFFETFGYLGFPGLLSDRITEVPADQEIVAYCRGRYCVLAHDAVQLLNARGRSARPAADGALEWRLTGHLTGTATS